MHRKRVWTAGDNSWYCHVTRGPVYRKWKRSWTGDRATGSVWAVRMFLCGLTVLAECLLTFGCLIIPVFWSLLERCKHINCSVQVPAGSPSRGGDVAVQLFDINQPSLPSPFYSALVSVSVFMAISAVSHSINPPDNSLAFSLLSSHRISALLVLSSVYISLHGSLP